MKRSAIGTTSVLVLTVLALICMAGPAYSEGVDTEGEIGTTIVGDQQAAIGLYLMPWSEEQAGDVDRPPRLLSEPLQPVDADNFRREAQWYRAQTAYRRSRLQSHQ